MSIADRSGTFQTDDNLVSVLYELLRDHVAPSVLERVVQTTVECPANTHLLSNGWLGQYAQDLADRLSGELDPRAPFTLTIKGHGVATHHLFADDIEFDSHIEDHGVVTTLKIVHKQKGNQP